MIFVCFTGTGATYAAAVREDAFKLLPYSYWDHDDEPNSGTEERNYAEIFVDRLLELKAAYRHVLIPVDFQVISLLNKRDIPYIMVIPDVAESGLKEEYAQRLRDKGHTDMYVEAVISHWEELLIKISQYSRSLVLLKSGEYASQILEIYDRVSGFVKIKALYKGRLVMAADLNGNPCNNLDLLQEFDGNIAFIQYDKEYLGYFYSEEYYDEPYFKTSPGMFEPVEGGILLKTKHHIYQWQVDAEYPSSAFEAQRELITIGMFFV